jgi:uncharacterized integral membrane protein
MKRLFWVFLFLASLAILILFSISNMETVKLNLYPNQPLPLFGYKEVVQADGTPTDNLEPRGIPVFLLIFLSVGLGFIIASIFSIIKHIKDKKEIRKLEKTIKKNEDEINSLRLIPIKEGADHEEHQNNNV